MQFTVDSLVGSEQCSGLLLSTCADLILSVLIRPPDSCLCYSYNEHLLTVTNLMPLNCILCYLLGNVSPSVSTCRSRTMFYSLHCHNKGGWGKCHQWQFVGWRFFNFYKNIHAHLYVIVHIVVLYRRLIWSGAIDKVMVKYSVWI